MRKLPVAAAILLAAACFALPQDELALKSQRAKQAMVERRFDDAARLYDELARALPRNAGMRMNLGLALHSAGRYREAIEQFSAALKLDGKLTPARILIGIGHQKLGEPAKAVQPLTEALRFEPENRLALLELADAHLALGQFEQAAPHFRKLTALEPSHAKAWQGLALSCLGLSRQAFEALEKAAPGSPYVMALEAQSLAEQQQYRRAFHLYRQAAGLRGAHAALAEIYRLTGHDDWARVEDERERGLPPPDCSADPIECAFLAGQYEQIASAKSADPRALYWKARSYSELALAALERLRQLPPSPEMHELLAEAHRVQGRHLKSAEEFREALRLDPGNAHLEAGLATSLWLNRDCQAALPLLEKMVTADPGSAQVHFELGDCRLQQQEIDRAIGWLEKAVKLNPGLLPARASLGRAYLRLGNATAAVEHLKAALPIDSDGSLHFQLARAYERAGRPELARQAFEKFEAISQAKPSREDREITAP